MKRVSIIKGLIRKNRVIVFIICMQVFFALFVSIFKFNRLKTVSGDLNYLSKKPVANSLFYMNKYPYSLAYKDRTVDNRAKIDENNAKVEDFVRDRKDLFKGISPYHIKYYDEVNLANVYMYDELTLKNMDKYIREGGLEKYEEGKPIPALVIDRFGGEYKIGSVFSLNLQDKSYDFKVTGFYSSDIRHLSTGRMANSDFPIGELFPENIFEIRNKQFIVPENDIFLSFKNTDKFNIPKARLIYFQDGLNENQLSEVRDFFENNDLGYYLFSEGLLKEQEEGVSFYLQQNLDMLIALSITVVVTCLCIAYINKDLFKSRFSIYIYNGASRKDVFFISTLYYVFIFFLPTVLYSAFSYFMKTDFARRHLTGSVFFKSFIFNNAKIAWTDLGLIFLIVLLMSIIFSLITVRSISSKFRGRIGR